MIRLEMELDRIVTRPDELRATAAYLTALADTYERPSHDRHHPSCATADDITPTPVPMPPAVPFEPPSDVELPNEPTCGTHDITLLPWDERIHASSKATNADGTWRQKRGVDKTYVVQVEAELRGLTAEPAPVGIVPPPPTVAPDLVPPPPVEAPRPITFAEAMGRITAAITEKRFEPSKVVEACQSVGIPAAPALAGMPHLIPQVMAYLGLDAQ